jgi:transcriptional regulator GlxA family with amidase domain
LLAGGASIEQVAEAVGFRSADVFRRAFERRFGIPPAQFRARFGAMASPGGSNE